MKELFSKTAEFICEFEGFREYAYKDSAGIWTVGYGQTYFNDGRKVLQFDKISKNESFKNFKFCNRPNFPFTSDNCMLEHLFWNIKNRDKNRFTSHK